MRTIESNTEYRTDDGRKFQRHSAAEAHERIMQLQRKFEHTKRELASELAARCKTADGERFQFGLLCDYYYITTGLFSIPRLLTVSFWGDNWTWKEENDETDTIVLISRLDDSGKPMNQGREHPVNELYASKEKAAVALKKAQLDWLDKQRAEIEGDKS